MPDHPAIISFVHHTHDQAPGPASLQVRVYFKNNLKPLPSLIHAVRQLSPAVFSSTTAIQHRRFVTIRHLQWHRKSVFATNQHWLPQSTSCHLHVVACATNSEQWKKIEDFRTNPVPASIDGQVNNTHTIAVYKCLLEVLKKVVTRSSPILKSIYSSDSGSQESLTKLFVKLELFYLLRLNISENSNSSFSNDNTYLIQGSFKYK